jgi:hypothetical protein
VGDVFDGPAPAAVVGKIILCKVGNIGGSFDFTETPEGPDQDPNGSIAADQSLANGKCLEVASDFSPDGSGNQVQIHELAAADPANTTQTIESCRFISKNTNGTLNPEVDCEVYADNQKLFVNEFHGFVVTYRNTFTAPPPQGCTYTKGWYRNKGKDTVTGAGLLSVNFNIADEKAIFAATPGKPNGVTWNGGNDVLNLAQQYLAALENGGATGPASIQTALGEVAAGLTFNHKAITTTFTQAQVSNYISILSNFNEGKLAGFPHCGDEVL